MERVTAAPPDRVHSEILDWLSARVGCDSSLFMPAPDRKIRPVQRNKDAFLKHFLGGRQRYQHCLNKGIVTIKREGMFVDVDVYSSDERRKLPFYADIIRPQGISSQLVIGVSFHERYGGTLFLCRHGAASRFCSSAVAHLRAVIPAIGLADAAACTAGAPLVNDELDVSDSAGRDHGLGAREREVAELARRGLETKEIAEILGTRPATVRNQLHVIFRKLEVSNRAELAFVLGDTSRGRDAFSTAG